MDAQPRPAPEGHGDLSRNWVGAGHLKIGDTIKQADGTTGLVANVTTAQQTREMFNLTVSEAHTYYVGNNEWLVHNVVCELKYKKGWSDAQKAEADTKLAMLNAGPRTVTAVAGRTNQRATYERAYGSVAPNEDVDHVIDLQLGGFDELMNYNPLDSSVNRSLGPKFLGK